MVWRVHAKEEGGVVLCCPRRWCCWRRGLHPPYDDVAIVFLVILNEHCVRVEVARTGFSAWALLKRSVRRPLATVSSPILRRTPHADSHEATRARICRGARFESRSCVQDTSSLSPLFFPTVILMPSCLLL